MLKVRRIRRGSKFVVVGCIMEVSQSERTKSDAVEYLTAPRPRVVLMVAYSARGRDSIWYFVY